MKKQNIMKNLLMIFVVAATLLACKEDEIKTYDGRPFIYFGSVTLGNGNVQWSDSTMYNFFFLPVPDTTIRVPVFCGGAIADVDREFAVDIEVLGGTPGSDFEIPEQHIMPAGSSVGHIPVKLISTEALDGNQFGVRLTLKPNGNFVTDMPEIYQNSMRDTLDRLTYKVEWDLKVSQPPGWAIFSGPIGAFTFAKYMLLTNRYEIQPSQWANPGSLGKFSSPSTGNPYLIDFANYLRDQIMIGPEAAIKDPDSTDPNSKGYMTIPGGRGVPAVTIPSDFPIVPGWTPPAK